MKKVKAMLAGITILAVVGGAFAFKAKSAFAANLLYTTANTYVTTCNLAATTPHAGSFATLYYYSFTDVATTSCITTPTHITSVEH